MENSLEIAQNNFNSWNAALATKDSKTVAAMYTEDATFLPTVSPEFKRGKAGAEGYFEHFLQKDPVGTIVEEAAQALNDENILHSGMYNFEIGPENARQQVEGRFTFLWQKEEEGWKIAHHHSSFKPTAQ